MKRFEIRAVLCAVVLSGCASGEDSSSDTTGVVEGEPTPAAANVEYRHRPRVSTGGAPTATGGTSSTGGAASAGGPGVGTADCAICTKANDCCNAVGAGTLCTFSAATCSTLNASAQNSYANNCKTLLVTVNSAWTSARATAPSACH